MNVEIYINATRADYGEKINVQYAIGNIADILSGRNNKSFEMALPRTDINRALFQHIDSVTVFDELAATGYVSVDGAIIIQGRVILKNITSKAFNIVISADDWIDELEGLSLRDLDLSALDHAYTESVITTAWSSGTTYQYPLVNFGKLSTPGSSDVGEASAETSIQDYYPMFRVKEIIEKILDRWTINSALLATAEFQKYYIYSHPAVKDDDFIQGKDFDAFVDSFLDNYDSAVLNPSDTASATVDKQTYANRVDIDGETTDQGGDYSADRYLVPEAGTYRFILEITSLLNWYIPGAGGVNSQSVTYKIVRRRSAADTDLATYNTSDWDDIHALQTLDTGRVHCEASDEIWVSVYLTVEATNGDSIDHTLEAMVYEGAAVTRLYNVMDVWCLFPGEGITVDTEAWLPDITQIDFLKAIKHMFNLRFGVDRNAQTIRIEPHDDFFTTNERDWTDYIDNADVDQDFVSVGYKAKQRFKFREDSNDTALVAYKIANAALPNSYDHSLVSVNTIDGIDDRESQAFADTSVGTMRPIGWWSTNVVRIWGELTAGYPFPLKRIRSWQPRIFYYDGATAGPTNLEFEGTGYPNYPQVSIPDWNDLFDDYWINNFHLIDAGKLVIVQAAIPVSEIQRFIMVVDTEAEEGFRARYKVKIGNDTFMATVNRIVYNGAMAKVELIILK